MAIHPRHREDPFEVYDLTDHKPQRKRSRKFRRRHNGNRQLSMYILPLLAFVLLVSVFAVKIIMDKRADNTEVFRNDSAVEIRDNQARLQRDLPLRHEQVTTAPAIVPATTVPATTVPLATEPEPTTKQEKAIEVNEQTMPKANDASDSGDYVYALADAVNIRKAASLDSDIVGHAQLNERLERLDSEGEFVKIKTSAGVTGYIHQTYVGEQPVELPSTDELMYVQVGQAYIRSGPGTDHDIIGFGLQGMTLTVLEPGAEWSLIRTQNGLTGYMLNELFGTQPTERVLEHLETHAVLYVNVDVATLRSGPGTAYEVVGALTLDDRVVQLTTDGSWSEVETSGGIVAYVRNDLLRDTPPINPYVTTNRTLYIAVDSANVRAAGSAESDIIAFAEEGDAITQIETDGTWSRIRLESGVEGYISNELLTEIAPAAPAPADPGIDESGSGSESGSASAFWSVSGTVYVNVSAARIRTEPSTTSSIVQMVYYGAELEQSATDGSWTKVTLSNGSVGFISNDLFQEDPVETSAPTPPPPVSSGGTVLGNAVAEIAMSLLGIPYVYGGCSLSGLDCSGLVKYCYNQAGYPMAAHGSNSQARLYGTAISFTPGDYSPLQPGDMLFFGPYGTVGDVGNYAHVGIYVGDGQMVHAPQPGDVVRCVSLYTHYQVPCLAKRILD